MYRKNHSLEIEKIYPLLYNYQIDHISKSRKYQNSVEMQKNVNEKTRKMCKWDKSETNLC